MRPSKIMVHVHQLNNFVRNGEGTSVDYFKGKNIPYRLKQKILQKSVDLSFQRKTGAVPCPENILEGAKKTCRT